MLKKQEKKQLLDVARRAVEEYVINGRIAVLPEPVSQGVTEKRGAFVTLKKHGALRGCIGTFVAHKPLLEVVADMARAAATEDPRFSPVVPEEMAELEFEISALTPLRRIDDPAKIEVGKHGIFIRHGFHSGVLLPQVAVEYGWDRREFLDETCWKAGLSKGCWKESGTTIEVFEAEVFE